MAPSSPALRRARFSIFEVDRSASQLLKGGRPVKLAPQPFKVLLLLLDRRGQVVSRGEIQRHLWGESTFVDFERGINFSINQIRAALGDDAERPRYIETLPKLGYRFVAEVTDGAGTEPAVHAAQAVVSESDLSDLSGHEPHPSGPPPAIQAHAAPVPQVAVAAVLAAIALLAIGIAARKRAEPLDAIQSLAVLPLEDLSGGAADEYFADGVTDSLITDLGQLAPLRVISRTSIMQYKRARRPLPQIARELGVDAVVEGTITRSGNRVRVTAQLIDARTDRHLWAHAYETEMGDVLALEGELAEVIADEVRGKISSPRHPVPKRVRSLPAPAQDAYLKGHYLQETGTIERLPEAISYFEQSIASEPNAPAFAGAASAYVALGHMMFLPPQEAFLPAKTAALKALELDDTLEDAHTALGAVKLLYDWDFPGAATEFQRAMAFNPSSVRAQNAYADYLSAMGRANEAIERARQGLELDPLSLSAIMNLAWQLYRGRHYQEAVAEAQKVADINPKFSSAHVCLGLAYEQERRFPEAIEELQKASGYCRDRCYGLIGQVFAMSGDRQAALEAMQQLQRRAYASPWLIAVIYAQLNDKDRAFAWLEKAYEGREHDLVFAGAWPLFDNLRADPRYRDLLRRVGLPQ
jgi:TolB-like protein/DNA-binding winged helix-turn-helix (wHTH) protein